MTHDAQLTAVLEAIDAQLRARGLKRQDLAALMGLSCTRISHMLNGYRGSSPTLRTLHAVAHALGMRLVIGFEAAESEQVEADPAVEHYFGGA